MVGVIENSRDDLLHKALFVPCTSKDGLARWVRVFLGIDLPSGWVCTDDDRHADTNSSPLDLLWEVYSKALDGTDPDYQSFLNYAARDTGKTVLASILELLCICHLRRNVLHLAAIEAQSRKCVKYLNRYVTRPIIRDFLTGSNKREVVLTRYEKNGESPINTKQWENLPPEEKDLWKRSSFSVVVTVATLSGVNSEHCSFVVIDEAELIAPEIFSEAQMIPSPGEERGELAITYVTSSRKFPFGTVQRLIDSAEDSGVQIRYWGLIDQTRPCPPSRHLPNEPKIKIYSNEETLRSIPQEDYDKLDGEAQNKWIKRTGYSGCLSQCSLFSVCQGRLATKQKSTSTMLKPIDHVIKLFKNVPPEKAKAQLMSWQPESVGLIYPRLSRTHCISAAQMIEKITGEKAADDSTRDDLIRAMLTNQMSFYSGLDHGFTHPFAIVTGGLWGKTLFIFHVIQVSGLELGEKISVMDREIKRFNPCIYPDPEDPSSNKSFKTAGYEIRKFTKDVDLGINTVRSKLTPTMSPEPELFFLAGEPGCENLYEQLAQYHWKIDIAGNPTEEPHKEDDDGADALRYLCQNLFGRDAIKHPGKALLSIDPQPYVSPDPNANWMQGKISELTGDNNLDQPVKIKKGGFKFSI